MSDLQSAREMRPAGGRDQKTVLPDLLLVHPTLESWVVQRLLPQFWPEGELGRVPDGYREISSACFSLRAFCRDGCPAHLPDADPTLWASVQEWVDSQTQRWDFREVFTARELNFWALLRDRMVRWFHRIMTERRALEQMVGDEELVVLAVGVDPFQRMLFRGLTERLQWRFRPEIAFVEPPAQRQRETITERRFRKLFFLLQDAWHGVQFLFEDLFVRKPKILLVSDSQCWMRRKGVDGRWARTDVNLEAVWREGRRRSLRLYYRTDSYHPDIGAMTGGRLPPTYLRHFLFVLAQTSRGFWETRSIQRKWRRLRENTAFRESLVFEGLPVAEMIISWLDEAMSRHLPAYVRDTRRETHFLRGIRPDVILLTHEMEGNRAILVAANALGIPTVALQLRPYQQWDDAYLAPPPEALRSACLPDRVCVFTPGIKAQLVEKGALHPSAIAVTGDPWREAVQLNAAAQGNLVRRMRRRAGIEGGQKVIAVSCIVPQRSRVLAWIGHAIGDRKGAFALIRFQGMANDEEGPSRQLAVAHGLRWFHVISQEGFAEAFWGIDLLVTTTLPEMAEAVLRRIPVVRLELDPTCALPNPDPGDLVRRVRSPEELRGIVTELLDGRLAPAASDAQWKAYVESVYGASGGGAASRVIETVSGLLHRD